MNGGRRDGFATQMRGREWKPRYLRLVMLFLIRVTVNFPFPYLIAACYENPGEPKAESLLVQFGAGHRSCLGKNISLLEIYKVVPTLLRRFDVSTLSPEIKCQACQVG